MLDLLTIAGIDPDRCLQPVRIALANHVTQSLERSHGRAQQPLRFVSLATQQRQLGAQQRQPRMRSALIQIGGSAGQRKQRIGLVGQFQGPLTRALAQVPG